MCHHKGQQESNLRNLFISITLLGCDASSSKKWHIGYYATGVMSEQSKILPKAQIENAVIVSAKIQGLDSKQSLIDLELTNLEKTIPRAAALRLHLKNL